jgi:HNH endonuclease
MATLTRVAGALHRSGCLFCLRSDGGFRSREHIFPEALGNHEHVLEPGLVCDRCNNGPLASADAALVNFQPIAMRRTTLRILGKRGTVPDSRWGNATLTHPVPGQIVFNERTEGAFARTRPNTFRLKLKTARPVRAPTYSKVARSVWKSTLEFIYVDHGADEAFAGKYDEVRAMICGQRRAHGCLLFAREGDLNRSDVTLTYRPVTGDDGRDRVIVEAWYYGMLFVTELLVRQVDDPQDELPALANVLVF